MIDLIVLTLNEEHHLPRCLESVKGLTANILVVDSGSTDRTAEVARRYGAEVVVHDFVNQATQLNWALDNIEFESDWILRLDADEYLTPELREELDRLLPSLPDSVTGLFMKRRVFFMGRWIRHGGYYPTWLLRAWRNGAARSEDVEINEHMVLLHGKSRKLKHDIVDHDLEGLSSWLIKHDKYADRYARFILALGDSHDSRIKPKLLGNQIERKRWLLHNYRHFPIFFRAFGYYIYRYFLRLGFLDGKEGFIFHFLQAFWFYFYVDAKIFEQHKPST